MTLYKSKKGKISRHLRSASAALAVCLALVTLVHFWGDRKAAAESSAQSCLSEDYTPVRDLSGYIPKEATPLLSAECAVLTDGDGNLLFGKLQDKRMPMASTTKIMTALVVAESCSLDKRVTVSAEAVGIEGSSIYLFEGEVLTVRELLLALLLESANDAAVALAVEVGGSVEGFAALMNQKAEALGLVDTHFVNPHGLDHEDHYTTARELAIITSHALKDPALKEIMGTQRATISHSGEEGVRLLINHNKLLRMYDGANGVKTGYTKRSGRCLVSSAERDGLTLIAVTLNDPRDWKDHASLLDMGFECFESALISEASNIAERIYLSGGSEAYVTATNTSDTRVTLPRSRAELTMTVELPTIAFAPIEKGERLGRIIYYLDGEPVAHVELCAMYGISESYRESFFEGVLREIGELFK